jgi:hypothetical protein
MYKSCLRRQNEQDSLPIRQKHFATDDILSVKSQRSVSSNTVADSMNILSTSPLIITNLAK